MKKIFKRGGRMLALAVALFAVMGNSAHAQTLETKFRKPLSLVMREVGERFGVKITPRAFDPDTLFLDYADFRIRPWSVEASLDEICRPLDLKWSDRGKRHYRIEPYEYYRRTPAEGEALLGWLAAKYNDRAQWEQRRDTLRRQARALLGLDPYLRGLAAEPKVILTPVVSHNGYTIQNFAIETLPGLYACGSVYAPAKGRGRHPMVLAPSGHWAEGRYRADHQYLMASMARMGIVAVDVDIFAWGESALQLGEEFHRAPCAMQVQALWAEAVTDWILRTRKDIDTERIGATGGSGGATHVMLLGLLDERFTALAPVVHLVSHFDGGCPCESARPVTLAAGGSCTTELLATFAPKPVLTVSDGGDWTHTYPRLEYPFLQRIWGFYGAENSVQNRHFADERHDFGASKRRAVYEFFAQVFGLDLSKADERQVDLVPAEALQALGGELPEGAIRSAEALEEIIKKLK